MSWRFTQLGNQLCDQDRLILSLFENKSVNYVGKDPEYQNWLTVDPQSKNLVLIFNSPMWVSDLINNCRKHLSPDVEIFYIGINRYQVLGNDTNLVFKSDTAHGLRLLNLISTVVLHQGFEVIKSGHFDHDLGRYFNFVQPLTWVYGHNLTNQSQRQQS